MRVSVNAHLSFGMVNVPVGVSPSTSRHSEISFKTLHAACTAPIKQDKSCSSCGKEHLNPEEIVKGFEVVKGNYVTFTEAELAELLPERSPIIKVETFMPAGSLNLSVLSENGYWLVPSDAFIAPYAVLVDAMTRDQAGRGRNLLSVGERPPLRGERERAGPEPADAASAEGARHP